MFMQKLIQSRVIAAKKSMTQVRNFSVSKKPPTSGGIGMMPIIVGGVGLAVFTYLNLKMSEIKRNEA